MSIHPSFSPCTPAPPNTQASIVLGSALHSATLKPNCHSHFRKQIRRTINRNFPPPSPLDRGDPSPFWTERRDSPKSPLSHSERGERSAEEVLVFAHPGVVGVGFARANEDLAGLWQTAVGVEQVCIVAQRCCPCWLHLCVCMSVCMSVCMCVSANVRGVSPSVGYGWDTATVDMATVRRIN